jgi:hypothetical protein
MKNSKNHIQKKIARSTEVKKILIEKRLQNRRELRFDKEREAAFEREFDEKNKLGLRPEEVKERLQNNMNILQALEDKYIQDREDKAKNSEKLMEQFKNTEEIAKLQQEIFDMQDEKQGILDNKEMTPEKEAELKERLELIGKKMNELVTKQKELIVES